MKLLIKNLICFSLVCSSFIISAQEVNKKELQESLKLVLYGNAGYSTNSQLKKAHIIVSLCGYYSPKGVPEELKVELTKLNNTILNLELLVNLTNSLERLSTKEFRWQPAINYQHPPTSISLAPTFNSGNVDTSSLISAIEKIRTELNSVSIDTSALISFISKKAKESGDLIEVTKNTNAVK